ncbi:head-tail connector protein [Lacticaseibacillus daqingensis]|uniref:hypothetical protein n=1 Tax=Lacticaseibacillus daqingensis TaxID=2486014 RepID=UPI000F7B077D|nr:hypothetical protein [Lacticaseibacillus daqingensis]
MTKLYVEAPEYVEAMHVTEAPSDYEELAALAGQYLDEITNYYYQQHAIIDDKFEMRVMRFKRAVMMQVRYMAETGIKSSIDYKASQAQSVSQSIGDTSVSKTLGDTAANVSGTIVCDDALRALSGTGLLYRGVMHL